MPGPVPELACGNIEKHGMELFADEEIFDLWTKKIQADGYEEEETLLEVCFVLFQRGHFDRTTLTYLSMYYCGATRNMKQVGRAAKKEGVPSGKIAARRITQKVFSENIFGEAEILGEDYDSGNGYCRLINQDPVSYINLTRRTKCRVLGSGVYRSSQTNK